MSLLTTAAPKTKRSTSVGNSDTFKEQRDTVFRIAVVELEKDARFSSHVRNAISEDGTMVCTRYLIECLDTAGAPLALCVRKDLFNLFLTFCGMEINRDHIGPNLRQALADRLNQKRRRLAYHRRVIRVVGLDRKSQYQATARADRFARARKIHANKLGTPYPPRGQWVVEHPDILKLWQSFLTKGKQHDERTPRRPIHMVRFDELRDVIGPEEDAIVYDKDTDRMVLVVYRNICTIPEFVNKADSIVQDGVGILKNGRLDDTGSIVQIGYSAGSRSAPTFDWSRNILSKRTTKETIRNLDTETSAIFAMFWNMCRAWLPSDIIQDIDNFTNRTCIPLMDAQHRISANTGKYTVLINDVEVEFHNALLAPPTGVMSTNYARAIHHEYQPHDWAISWTTDRTSDDDLGGAFYLARYGIRVTGAKNTLIAWQPEHYHGTSLQRFSPYDENPTCTQRGLAIVTPKRLEKVWQDYVANKVTREDALRSVFSDEDIEY